MMVNLTALKQTEARLRNLSDRLTLALKAGAIGTWDWDFLHEVSWDDGMYEVYGFQNLGRAATYEDWVNTLHPDDRGAVESALQKAIQGEKEFDVEFRITRPDGALRFIKASAITRRNHQGEPQHMVGINYDITEQKQAEAKLIQYTEEVEDLYNNAPCGYHSLDAEGRFFRVNATELQWLGYTHEEMIGRLFTEFLTEESCQIFWNNYPIFCQRGWVKDIEFDMVCKDGSILPVLVNATAVVDEAGNYLYSRSTLTDSRDRKQAEAQLQFQADILQDIHDSVISTDCNGIIESWNHGAERIFGYQAVEMIGQSVGILYDNAEELATIIDSLLINDRYEAEVACRNKSGELINVHLRLSLRRDEQGNVVRLLGVSNDISIAKRSEAARQQAEAENRLLQERLQFILFSNPAVLYTCQPAENLTATFISDNLVPQFGYIPDDFMNRSDFWHNCIHPEDRSRVLIERLKIFEQGHQKLEYRMQHQNGEYRWIQDEIRLVCSTNEETSELVGYFVDISDRKQFEQKLQQTNAELARATRLKDEFLANMSHELRTPLTSILGMSDILKQKIYGELNEKQHQYIEVIHQSGKHLLSLINDILDLAKIESGKLELQITSVPIQELCNSSLNFVKQIAQKKRIKLTTSIPSDVGEIDVDELRIRQALINLLSNAVKFTPEGGQVVLEVKHDDVRQMIQFRITDTGVGIAAEDIPKLFQSFVQIDSSLSRQYGGTGLGLSLVRKIAELHQGRVTVESLLGHGSCFTLTLPDYPFAKDSPLQVNLSQLNLQSEQTNSDVTHQAIKQPLILLAEDNQVNIQIFSDYLIHCGYRLLIATDGQEVVSLAREHQPNVILMDIQMPKVDGLEAMRQIRSIPELADTPVIALTALAMTGDRERCLAAGANAYLTKPVRLKQLVETIQQFCQ